MQRLRIQVSFVRFFFGWNDFTNEFHSTHTRSSMARHQRSHSNLKPYKCDVCHQEYADRKRLRDHMLKHQGVNPFSCQICDYTSRR